jgi:hypothetical protein
VHIFLFFKKRWCRHPKISILVLLLGVFMASQFPSLIIWINLTWVPLCLLCRGDIPFCTEDCRREQIEMDEEMERKESKPKNVAPRGAPSPKDVDSPPRPPKARAGSILAG